MDFYPDANAVAIQARNHAFENLPRGFVNAAKFYCDRLAQHPVEPEVMAALAELEVANNEPNPIYVMLKQRFAEGRGLTQDEVTQVAAYIQFRTESTVGDIASIIRTLITSFMHRSAGEVVPNLSDELEGKYTHLDMLNNSIAKLCDTLGARHLDHATYPLARTALMGRKEDGTLPAAHEFAVLTRGTASEANRRGRSRRSLEDTAKEALKIAQQLPTNAYAYGQRIDRLTEEDINHPDSLRHVCAAAVRLAIRESSSAGSGGVIDIWRLPIAAYQGYFDKNGFREVSDYHIAHIGNGNNSKGAEDAHEKQATRMAIELFDKLLREDPKALAEVLRTEAETCRVRNAQGQSFVNAMQRSRKQPGETGSYLAPINQNPNRERLTVSSARDELPIAPGRYLPEMTMAERFVKARRVVGGAAGAFASIPYFIAPEATLRAIGWAQQVRDSRGQTQRDGR